MRLLHLETDGSLSLTEFSDDKLPPYAILSHTWRPDGGEVTFRDVSEGIARRKAGYTKVSFCGAKAASHGLKYFWVDTCCIDKSSSAELQESINSMFRWYRGAARCYVYLADVSIGDHDLNSQSSQFLWESAFRASRWFTRGWTLQELLAPSSVEFFEREGRRLGDKKSFERQIHEITKIPISALQGTSLSQFGVDERFSWAQNRETTRKEDWAYSLLGIFDIFIPLLYGEGREKAVVRLRKEIKGASHDDFRNNMAPDEPISGLGNISLSSGCGVKSPNTEGPATNLQQNSMQSNSKETVTQLYDFPPEEEDFPNSIMGPTSQEVRTHDSIQSWIRSFQTKNPISSSLIPPEDFAARLAQIKQLVQSKGAVIPPADLRPWAAQSNIFDQVPRSRLAFYRKQPVPKELRELVQRSVRDSLAHVIIQGLGPSGKERREKTFPINAPVGTIHQYLEQEGFGPLCAFKVDAEQGSYNMKRSVPKTTITPVQITDGSSCYTIQDGYCINENEQLVDFYNARFASKPQVKVVVRPDCIEVRDKYNQSNEIFVDFKRTVRVPDDGKTYDLPPPLASFPLLLARHFSSTLPDCMRQKGGIFFPMLQREAFTLAFSSSQATQSQFAIRVFTGAVNVLTGQPALESRSLSPNRDKDYVVAPKQGLLSGYSANGLMKQFVAMPMGEKYTVEQQITGEEFIGGVQLEIIPRLRETVTFRRHLGQTIGNDDDQHHFDLYATPRELGLHAGHRITMEDHNSIDLYEYIRGEWEPSEDLVEPEAYSDLKTNRPTFIRELFDGPSLMNFDPSSSLIISVINPVRMTFGPLKDTGETISFSCSPFARISDIRRFLIRRITTMSSKWDWIRSAYVDIIIKGKSYGKASDLIVGDLNLESPQRISLSATRNPPSPEYLGAGGLSTLPDTRRRIVPGWDMGVAMGGQIKQVVKEDESPHTWNWNAARAINIQIINAVAFRAVTGLSPPISPLSFAYHMLKGIHGTPQPAVVKELTRSTQRLLSAKSVNDLDWERGAAPDVTMDGNSVILCVCCEVNICDSVLDTCGHLFCRVCIAYYMTDNTAISCAYCSASASRVVQFSAAAEVPHKPMRSGKLAQEAEDMDQDVEDDALEIHEESIRALKSLTESLDGSLTVKEIEDAIEEPSGGKLPGKSAALQMLLGQATRNPGLMANLPIGYLIRRAFEKNNRDAWHMLVPLYKLTNHDGLRFAQESGLNILAAVKMLSRCGVSDLARAEQLLGPSRAMLLAELGIII